MAVDDVPAPTPTIPTPNSIFNRFPTVERNTISAIIPHNFLLQNVFALDPELSATCLSSHVRHRKRSRTGSRPKSYSNFDSMLTPLTVYFRIMHLLRSTGGEERQSANVGWIFSLTLSLLFPPLPSQCAGESAMPILSAWPLSRAGSTIYRTASYGRGRSCGARWV